MIWLILGPSGAGKSSFGEWLAAERNWFHMEIDRYPEGDGIDLNNLRHQWDEFYIRRSAKRFGEAMRKLLDAKSKSHMALTFPGNLVLPSHHMDSAAQAGLRTVYLYGSAAQCIDAFLAREQRTGRQLGLSHWIEHNGDSYLKMSEPSFAPYRVHVFTHTCARRPHADVFESLFMLEREEQNKG